MDYTGLLVPSLAGGAIITAGITLAQLLVDSYTAAAKRADERDRRRLGDASDAEARLERVLQDRLAEADRRLDRLQHTQEMLLERYASLGLRRRPPRPRRRS